MSDGSCSGPTLHHTLGLVVADGDCVSATSGSKAGSAPRRLVAKDFDHSSYQSSSRSE